MRAVEVSPGRIDLVDVERPAPGTGEARIVVEACGICGTDLHLAHGIVLPAGAAYPLRPGHEVCGVIAELGPDDPGASTAGLAVGDRVVLHPLDPCGTCASCRSDAEQHCAQARVLGISAPGGMADEVVWPIRRLVPVPSLPPVGAALLPDAVATAWRALSSARLPKGGVLLVIGAGGVGTHVLELARYLDPTARLGAVVRSDGSRRRLAGMGLDFVHAGTGSAAGPFRTALGSADAVVDFSGTREGPRLGVRLLRSGGRLVLGSILDEDADLGSITGIVTRGIRIVGSYSSTIDDLRTVADLAASGAVDLSASVSATFALSDARAAYRMLEERPPGLVRIVLARGAPAS